MDAIPPGTDLSKIPLGVNPSEAPPNFVDPPSLISTVQAVGAVLATISLLLVLIRLGVYRNLTRGILLDDASIVIAFVLAIAYTVIVSTLDRASRHAWDTPLSILDADYLKKLFVTSLLYGPMLFFAKASILLLYHRAFHPKKWLRICVYIMLTILFLSYLMTVPMAFVWCMPQGGAPWDLTVLGTCDHLATPGLVQGSINIAADLAIFFLPLPVIIKLQIPVAKKIALAAIFATGLLALVASVLTMYYRVMIIRGIDTSWAGAQTYICIQAEIYAAICVACMPSLARVGKIKFKETKFFASLQSLLRSMKGTSQRGSEKSFQSNSTNSPPTRNSHSSIETLTGIATIEKEQDEESKVGGSLSDLRYSEENFEKQHQRSSGIFRMIEVHVSSEPTPLPTPRLH